MGMTEEQLAIFKIPHFLTTILVFTCGFMVARLAAIAYSRRYFVPNSASSVNL
jgi:hypothetical protein